MIDENKNMDAFFRDELNNFQIIPPAEIWNNIESELDRRKKIYIISIWTSLAAGIALFIGLGIYLYAPKHTNEIAFHPIAKQHNELLVKSDLKPQSSSLKQTSTQLKLVNNNDSIQNIQHAIYSNHAAQLKQLVCLESTQKSNQIVASGMQTVLPENKISQPTKTTDISSKYTLKTQNIIPGLIIAENKNISENRDKEDTVPGKKSLNKQVLVYDASNPFNEYVAPEVPKVKRWSIEGQVAPLYSYRNFTGNSDIEEAKNYFNSTESGILSYAGVVKVSYQVSARLSVQAGVSYEVMGYSNSDVSVSELNTSDVSQGLGASSNSAKKIYTVNTSAGKVTPKAPISNGISTIQMRQYALATPLATAEPDPSNKDNSIDIQQFQFVEIPVMARYKIIDNKISLHILGGLSSNILVSSNNYQKNGNEVSKYGSLNDLNSFNYSSTVGFGIGYKLDKNMKLILEPSYKYFINSISNNGYGIHPYSIGVYTGLNFTF